MREIVKVGKTTKSTWVDRRGETYSLHLDKKDLGLRVNVHRWLDTDEVDIKLIDGDGRSADFKQFAKVTIIRPTQEEINQKVRELVETYLP